MWTHLRTTTFSIKVFVETFVENDSKTTKKCGKLLAGLAWRMIGRYEER
jgi:hypothetical protein